VKKRLFAVAIALAAAYLAFSLTGVLLELSPGCGHLLDAVYRAITVLVVGYMAAICFIKAAGEKNSGVLLTGALALGTLFISELHYLARAVTGSARRDGLYVSDFSDASSYLLFLAAIMLLLLATGRWVRTLKVGVSAVSVVIMGATTLAVVGNYQDLLYITAAATTTVSVVLSAYLLFQTRRVEALRTAALFGCSLLAMGAIDMAVYLSYLLDGNRSVQTVLVTLYTPIYVVIGAGLLRLREGQSDGG